MDYRTFLQQQRIKKAAIEPHLKNDRVEVWFFHTNDHPPRHGKVRHQLATDEWKIFWAEDPWKPQ